MNGADMGTLSQALREPARIHSFLGSLKLMETLCVRVAWRLCCDPDKAGKPDCGTWSYSFTGNVTEGANDSQRLSPRGRVLVTDSLALR